jgi:hypothetical protein
MLPPAPAPFSAGVLPVHASFSLNDFSFCKIILFPKKLGEL